ncbi:C-3 sterol dehydrogenase/C-4 decarboxylase family protein [Cordyceps fumosorosea ARSEF 2679]|uniref:Sterol-4-alpha-carboxylate 3-dehydrogenase ERG26, decarboxylating n=1 Tax=Cordyceps fumosorosea (strain ARSEF 2679) TaxID=1081104 RepID=A0A162J7I0_CORFA|nr:C-3 sterol dehydrogenase/C-4 decarboxylase family protein [Cordyceps fumosorosea ARSEF 2679]OAA64862.1 C-3 sterol dehydrogenase/C-4 decarboxylase family protein [Cordyceps fumosorosea ARSEF 2679]
MSARTAAPKGDLGKVLVVGGNGFLGHHIVNQALDDWHCRHVVSVDLRCDRHRRPDATYHECDITDGPKLAALFESLRPDVVIHTASPVASDNAVHRELFRRVNVDGTASVVAACRAARVKALVYTSSASVVSDFQSDLRNADERWPVIRGAQQPEYYSETKAAAEELVTAANRVGQDGKLGTLLTTSIRPAGIFGEGDVQALAGLLGAYRTGKSRVQLGDNDNIFDFTYVGNVAHAHLLAARLLLATAAAGTTPLDHERVDGETFFVTNDEPVYFWDFARSVWRAAGNPDGTEGVWRIPRDLSLLLGMASEIFSSITRRKPTFTKQRAVLSTMTRYYNIAKARSVLGYEPQWSLQEGVDRGVKWFLENEKAEKAAKA